MDNEVLYKSHAFLQGELGKSPCRELLTRYQEPHRVYHGEAHIAQMLTAVDEMATLYSLSDKERVLLHLGTWYHDAIYEVGSKDNERQSAILAVTELCDHPHSDYLSQVFDLVMTTKSHDKPRSLLECIIVDADLQGLGSKTVYLLNSVKVLKEAFGLKNAGADAIAKALDSEAWINGRKAFIDAYLSRPTLYFTSWGAQYEAKARQNMKDELKHLNFQAERQGF